MRTSGFGQILLALAGCAHAKMAASGGGDACLAGDCTNGKGVKTLGHGPTRALYEGSFANGLDDGDGVITRVAGEVVETLAIDAASQTGTIAYDDISVVGAVTSFQRNAADGLPDLDDESAAVMLSTGEFLFADWCPTTVAPKDSTLTDARRIARLPEEYADLFAGAAVLEDARKSGRALEIQVPGVDHPAPHHTVASLVVYAPEATNVAYIVGVGVPDPASAATAKLRAGVAPSGPIPILGLDGKTTTLELRGDAVIAWPSEVAATAVWRPGVAALHATYASAAGELDTALRAAHAASAPTDYAAALHRAATGAGAAAAAADDAAARLPGVEAARHARLVELARVARTRQAHAEFAARLADRIEPARAAAAQGALADALAAATGTLDTNAWDR